MKLWLLCAAACLAVPSEVLSQDLAFSPDATLTCLEAGGGSECVGLSASTCIDTPDGYTTVGMGFCYDAERRLWDARLNEIYGRLLTLERKGEAELKDLGSSAPETVEPLRQMQRAWISFRDAACDYERVQWGGGTGGGPATVQCLMQETAAQTLRLARRLADLEGR